MQKDTMQCIRKRKNASSRDSHGWPDLGMTYSIQGSHVPHDIVTRVTGIFRKNRFAEGQSPRTLGSPTLLSEQIDCKMRTKRRG